MTPLDHLDQYMLVFAVGSGLYLLFMFLLLFCFLKKFTPHDTVPVYTQALELETIKTYNMSRSASHPRAHVPKLSRSHTRSNRSHSSSSTYGHRKRRKLLLVRRPDISQMERLATL